MMSLSVMSAGAGYRYLTGQTVNGDRARSASEKMTDYYVGKGTPAGVWMTVGDNFLGVDGGVSETQMAALFGNGWHPRAAGILTGMVTDGLDAGKPLEQVCGRAVRAVKLGRDLPGCGRSPVQLQATVISSLTTAQRTLGRPLMPAERAIAVHDAARKFIADVQADQGRYSRQHGGRVEQVNAVAGFDLTFSPPKSVSIQWGLGDDKSAALIEAAHTDAIDKTLQYLGAQALFSRKGIQSVATVDVEGMVAARFRHWTNRNNEPDLHDHVTVANQVLCSDRKIRTIDGRYIHKWKVAASEFYNRKLADNLRAAGFATRQRDMGVGIQSVTELAHISDQQIARFSTRRAHIKTELQVLRNQYRDAHGRWPSRATELKLAQAATLGTRAAKHQLADLNALKGGWVGTSREATDAVRMHGPGRAIGPATGVDAARAAADIIDALQGSRSTWEDHHMAAAVTRWCSAQNRTITVADQKRITKAVANSPRLRQLTPAHPEFYTRLEARQGGQSIYVAPHQSCWTTTDTLAAEDRLVAAATDPFGSRIAPAAVKAAIASSPVGLGTDQQRFVEHLAGSGHGLAVGIGPAGAGKTTALAALATAAHDCGVKVQALALARRTATDLGAGIGADSTWSLAAWQATGRGEEPGRGAAALSAGDVVVIDEAGVVATHTLDQIVAAANAAGAQVIAVGDDRQLSAIGAGGGLGLIARRAEVARLDTLHRFTDPAEAAATLALHDHGDVAWYIGNARVHGGDADTMTGQIVARWAGDRAQGRSALMIAASNGQVAALNDAAQQRLIDAGTVQATGRAVAASSGAQNAVLHVGDDIITRKGDRTLIVSDRVSAVQNGDRWRVTRITRHGTVHAVNAAGKAVVLPRDYVASHVQLGYAATGYIAQGVTVDAGYWITDDRADATMAYPAMTRGRERNEVFITGVANDAAAADALGRIAATDTTNRSASDTINRLWAHTDDAAHLIRVGATEMGRADAYRYVAAAAGAGFRVGRDHRTEFYRALRAGEAAGISPRKMLTVTAAGDLRAALAQLPAGTAGARTLDAATVAGIVASHLDRIATGDPRRPLAGLSDQALAAALHTACEDRQQAVAELREAVGHNADQPRPVTLPDGTTIPSWAERDMGHLTDTTLASRQDAAATTLAAANRNLAGARWRQAAADATLTRLNTPGHRLDAATRAAAQAAEMAHDARAAAETAARQAATSTARYAAETARRDAMTPAQRATEDHTRTMSPATETANPVLAVWRRQQAMRALDAANDTRNNADTLAGELTAETAARNHTPDLAPAARPRFDRPGSGNWDEAMKPADRATAAQVDTEIAHRIDDAGARIAADPGKEPWAEQTLGPVPALDDPLRASWEHQAGRIDTYRQLTGHTDQAKALPTPTEAANRVDRWTDPTRDLADLRSRAADIARTPRDRALDPASQTAHDTLVARLADQLASYRGQGIDADTEESRTRPGAGEEPRRAGRRQKAQAEAKRETPRWKDRRYTDDDRERGRGRGLHL